MPFILGSVYMSVDSVAVGLIILPLSVKDVTVDVPELSFTMRFVVLPLTFVASSIRPNLDTPPMPHGPSPLALVDCPVLKPVLITKL